MCNCIQEALHRKDLINNSGTDLTNIYLNEPQQSEDVDLKLTLCKLGVKLKQILSVGSFNWI